jgi:hypothetical protein
VLPSGQKLTLGLLTTIALEMATFRAYTTFPALLRFLHAFWKSYFAGAFDSASLTSVLPK